MRCAIWSQFFAGLDFFCNLGSWFFQEEMNGTPFES